MGMNKATEGIWLPQGKYGNEQDYIISGGPN